MRRRRADKVMCVTPIYICIRRTVTGCPDDMGPDRPGIAHAKSCDRSFCARIGVDWQQIRNLHAGRHPGCASVLTACSVEGCHGRPSGSAIRPHFARNLQFEMPDSGAGSFRRGCGGGAGRPGGFRVTFCLGIRGCGRQTAHFFLQASVCGILLIQSTMTGCARALPAGGGTG